MSDCKHSYCGECYEEIVDLRAERDRLNNLAEMGMLTVKAQAKEISRLKAEVEADRRMFEDQVKVRDSWKAKVDRLAGALKNIDPGSYKDLAAIKAALEEVGG